MLCYAAVLNEISSYADVRLNRHIQTYQRVTRRGSEKANQYDRFIERSRFFYRIFKFHKRKKYTGDFREVLELQMIFSNDGNVFFKSKILNFIKGTFSAYVSHVLAKSVVLSKGLTKLFTLLPPPGVSFFNFKIADVP